MYNHNISTLMLSEVSGMVDPARQERIDRALARALRVILSAQQVPKEHRHDGGWRYQHTSKDSDMSLTGWGVMALRSARNGGAAVPDESIARAIRFILNCRTGDGGFSYQPGGSPGLGRTGTALLCLELTGQHRSRASLAAGDWILRRMPGRWGDGEHFCYSMYYAAQATFQLGDRYWERFGTRLYDIMLRAQERDGGWPQDSRGGPDYSTAMAVLAMSVSYRQLPIYQR
jgi:prenyltransferase beta subunit